MSTTSLRPLTDYVDPIDIPLFDFIDADLINDALDQILVANAWTSLDDSGFTLYAEFNLGTLVPLSLPGLDQIQLAFNPDGMARGALICGENSSLELGKLKLSIIFSKELLVNEAKDEGASIEIECGVRIDGEGFHFLSFSGASLPRSRIAGTNIFIRLQGIEHNSGDDEFLKIGSGTLELGMFSDSAKQPLILEADDLSFSRYGPSGRFVKKAGPALSLSIGGFECKVDEGSVTLKNGYLQGGSLRGRLNLSAIAPSEDGDGWVSVDFSIGSGGVSAALSSPEAFFSLHIPEMFVLAVSKLRLDATKGQEALWLSGTLTPEIKGLNGSWPTFDFDEIGFTPQGQIRLAAGAQIATTAPFTLDWNFATLTVTAFSLERPEGAPDELKLRVSAGIELVKGVPAGASVDGLVAHWHERKRKVDITFNGIGVKLGSPGSFTAAIEASWDSSKHAFSGSGSLQIPSIDLDFSVIFESRWVAADGFATMFLAAETSFPGGVPIASTGFSLYAVSGIVAHNYEIKTDDPTDPKRFYKAFIAKPEGFASVRDKWVAARDRHAIGLGVVIGTADDGWAFSARGALLISFPDLSVIVTASANLLAKREPIINGKEGKLTAALAILPAQKMIRLDFGFAWDEPPLFQIKGEGGGEANFDRPLDLLIWAGLPPEEGNPISGQLFRFGDWLFNGRFWVKINAWQSFKAGAQAALALRAGSDRIYAELAGMFDGHFTLTCQPFQFDGRLDLDARARLVAEGLSLSHSLVASVAAQIPKPDNLRIGVRSCIDLNLGFKTVELCLEFTFSWGSRSRPVLPAPQMALSIFPRDWVSRPATAPDAVVDDGIALWPLTDGTTRPRQRVQPHSILALEFSKSMALALVDALPAQINDVATPLPQPIGGGSDFAERWSLTRLVLRDVTLGKDVALFGTFQRSPVERADGATNVSPRPDNSQLWLLSSNRFGAAGSIGGGGAQDTPHADCRTTRLPFVHTCVPLAGLAPGWGTLDNGWTYHWRRDGNTPPPRRDGVLLDVEDMFEVWVPDVFPTVTLEYLDLTTAGQPPRTSAEITRFPQPIRLVDGDSLYQRICYDEWVVADSTGARQDWRGSSGKEEWTLAKDCVRTLHPGHVYTMTVEVAGQVLEGGKTFAPDTYMRTYEFEAERAPDWPGALEKAIHATYPNDGMRPVFRGYDMIVRFKDDYVRQLYELDGRRLGIRLRDANGTPVEFASGRTISPPVDWTTGAVVLPPVEKWWRDTRATESCEAGAPPPDCATILPVALAPLDLRPLATYHAELVGVEDEATEKVTAPLASWSFTTAAFKTFSELAAAPARVPAFGLVQQAPPASDRFDDLIRAFGAPDVTDVPSTRVTPVRVGDAAAYVLLEAPEPLDDVTSRLTVVIGSKSATLVPNLDYTRIVAVLKEPVQLSDPDAHLDIVLLWKTDPVVDAPEARRVIASTPLANERCPWKVPLRMLF